MAGRNDDKFRCSFCGKTQDQVRKLIAGPNGAYICDECVDICAEIIDEELENDEAAGEVAEPEEQINLLKPEELKAFWMIMSLDRIRQKCCLWLSITIIKESWPEMTSV